MNDSSIVIARYNQIVLINGKSRKTWPNLSRSRVIIDHDMKFKGFNIGRISGFVSILIFVESLRDLLTTMVKVCILLCC